MKNLLAKNTNAFLDQATHCVELEKRIREMNEAMTKLESDNIRFEQEIKDHDVRANNLLKEKLSSLQFEYDKLKKEVQSLRLKANSFLDILGENSQQVNKLEKASFL
jgi:chromosome segregation ATPase